MSSPKIQHNNISFIIYFFSLLSRPLRQSMATIWRQAHRETKDANIQMHIKSSLQRIIQFQCAMGENKRMFIGCNGDGL